MIQQYASEVPRGVRSVFKALEDDSRVAIVVALMKNDKMTFTELKQLFDMNSSSLSYHLSILQDAGLVDNILQFGKEGHYSFYSVTDMTKSTLESLYDNIIKVPVPRIEPVKSSLTGVELHRFEQEKFASFAPNKIPSKKQQRLSNKIRSSSLFPSDEFAAT